MAPVRLKCERVEIFPATESKPALVMDDCEWQVDDGVKAVTLDCAKGGNRYVVTRNMDNARGEYPWRISRFDMDSGEPVGHTYGKSAADTLNKHVSRHEKCVVTKVRTQGGRDDFGDARFEKLTTTLNSSAPTREAQRVIGAFLRGENARGACTGKREARKCVIVSRRNTLEVGGEVVARRDGRNLSICVASKAAMEKRGKRQRETEAAKDVRVAASSILRRVAGVAVRSDAEGQRLLSAGGRASLLVPAGCIQVRISKRDAARLLTAAKINATADAEYNTEFPTKPQLLNVQRMLREQQRADALTKAQAKRRMRVGPAPVPFPEEEYTPEVEAPEAPLPEYAPVEYDAPAEDDTFDFEPAEVPAQTARILPTDVRYPLDEATLVRFETEFVSKLRSPKRKAAAEAWLAYLINPEGERTPGQVADAKAVREIENILANEYGIVDPLYGYVPPEWAGRGPRPGTERKKRSYDPIQAEKMRLVRTERTGYKQREAKRAEDARIMRELRKGIKIPKIRNLKNK